LAQAAKDSGFCEEIFENFGIYVCFFGLFMLHYIKIDVALQSKAGSFRINVSGGILNRYNTKILNKMKFGGNANGIRKNYR